VLEGKKAHRAAAEKLGLKTIGIATSAFAQFIRTPLLGVNGNDWEISGDGTTPFAVTTTPDVGRYIARAVILSNADPSSLPSRLRVYSEVKTWNEYAEIHEKVTGQKVNRIHIPREKVLEIWKSGTGGPFYFIRVLADTIANNFLGTSHNELLNPGEKYFKPTSWEEYVKSTVS